MSAGPSDNGRGDPARPRRGPSEFPTTHWTLVRRAGAAPDGALTPEAEEAQRGALGTLVSRYRTPLLSHLLVRRGLAIEDAEDVLQSFLADRIVAAGLVRQADAAKGKFRTLLLNALDWYAANHERALRAAKRAPDRAGPIAVAIDGSIPIPDARSPAPDDRFVIEWARQVVRQAVDQMRGVCHATGRPHLWELFRARLLDPALVDAPAASMDELASRLSLGTPQEASNLLVTGKRMFARSLRAVIGEYERTDADVDEELADLRRVLGDSAAGRWAEVLT